MVFSNFVVMGTSFSGASALPLTTAQQGGLTQGLVVLVILVVIAVALILVCGFMGRRADEKSAAVPGDEDTGLAAPQATSPEATAAASVVAAVETQKEAEEALPQPETETKPVGPVTEETEEIAAAGPAVTEVTSPEKSAAAAAVAAVETEEEAGEVEVVPEDTLPQPESETDGAVPVTEEVAEEAQVAAVVPPAPPEPDDLKRIEGIGPKVSSLLNDKGIFTFAQLADTDVSWLKSILDEAGLTMMNPAAWPTQARVAASGDWDALASLQDELKGGRHA